MPIFSNSRPSAEKSAGAAAAAGGARPWLVGEGGGRARKQRRPGLRARAASTSAQILSRKLSNQILASRALSFGEAGVVVADGSRFRTCPAALSE